MDNKLSELSKPVAWLAIYHGDVYDESISITRSVVEAQADRFGWEPALTEITPLYSQEYVSALTQRIAELERARFIAWPGAMFAPVLARIKVDVKHRDGSLSVGKSAGNVVWYHSDSPSDVVAFALAVEGG